MCHLSGDSKLVEWAFHYYHQFQEPHKAESSMELAMENTGPSNAIKALLN